MGKTTPGLTHQQFLDCLDVLLKLGAERAINEKTIALYTAYAVSSGKTTTTTQLMEKTGLSRPTVIKHTKLLEIIGMVSVDRRHGKGNEARLLMFTGEGCKGNLVFTPPKHSPGNKLSPSNGLKVSDPSSSLTINTLNTLRGIVNVKSKYDRYFRLREKKRTLQAATDIKVDRDWKRASGILGRYFTESEINPSTLVRDNRFMKLCSLLLEEEFDFSVYCQWYKEIKYPTKGFNYGLFLYPNMVDEFRKDAKRWKGKKRYLKTTTMWKDEVLDKRAEATREWIDKMISKKRAK